MYNEIGSNHVQINSVRIIRNQDPQPRYGIACIEELPSEEDDIEEVVDDMPAAVSLEPTVIIKTESSDE